MHTKMETVRTTLLKLSKGKGCSYTYRRTLVKLLRQAVPFDAACCTTVDPESLLSTGALTDEEVESIHDSLFEYDYFREDYIPYHQLVKAVDPTATLSGATEGQLTRSARYRNVLSPAGFSDELRAALMYKGVCWGYLTLFRRFGRPLFTEEERVFIASLVPVIALRLRRSSFAIPAEIEAESEVELGILVLDERLGTLSANEVADRWLSRLRKWERIGGAVLPRPVRTACFRALSVSTTTSPAKSCVHLPGYPYLTIRASKLHGLEHAPRLAVSFETAGPADTLRLLAEACELSEREKQILDALIKGMSTKELALSLHISAYTVQDHIKSIFVKTGVTSRRELVWRLFSRFGVV
ncbi:LuxR family transcriptional regulator [Aneurinibacillus soli]|uniref:DNA-binding transcriptional regulator CsgD n=1 Tax=Aneurinibacillus soli TaxID=1500254 RepID=A0A0U5B3S6_9BACL|nr:helix-turn-helix transcriptional regulator [Aneurinibacillus soli]PYE62933.1 LuxR family transcriptional regulator [Aneurinibacillus soli]BAU29008.1 DNA-binding transcriptional regulator CsgD [Aneurinibacillus soli]